MENPIAIAKQQLSVSKVIGFAVLAFVVFALFDLAGLTNWILFPATNLKAKFGKKA